MFRSGTYLRNFILTSVLFAGLITVVFVQLPGSTLFWRELQNSGHTILFVMITLTFMVMIRPAVDTIDSLYSKYMVAVALLLSAAVLAELGQMLTHREPSLFDIARNISGILIGLGIYASFEIRLWRRRWPVGRIGVLLLTTLVLALSLTPLLKLAYAYEQRNQAFPLISDFQSVWARQFIGLDQAVMTQVSVTNGLASREKHSDSQLELMPGVYSGISIAEPLPDWSAYTRLLLELYSTEMEAFNLIIRIHDHRHNQDFYDRFNQVITVVPGMNRYQIPLSHIEHAPQTRMMDMDRISGVMLFASSLDEPLKVQLGELRLE